MWLIFPFSQVLFQKCLNGASYNSELHLSDSVPFVSTLISAGLSLFGYMDLIIIV